MRWSDFSSGSKLLIVVVALWWVFGAWLAAAAGFKDPMFILGLPFILGFIFIAIVQALIWLLHRLER